MANTGKRRFGFSLGARFFFISGALILLAVGSAIVFTYRSGLEMAGNAVRQALSRASSLQSSFQQQRFEQLQLIARLLASDPTLEQYLQESSGEQDLEALSILELLAERQDDLGFDFAIVTDPAGLTLARSDVPGSVGEDLSQRSLVEKVLEEFRAEGLWEDGGRLYFAVAEPVVQEADLLGYLVTGFAVDDVLALQLRNASGTEVTFLADVPTGPAVVATTLDTDLAQRLLFALRAQGNVLRRVLDGGEVVDGLELTLRDAPWIALMAPLRDAARDTVGASVTLASLDQQLTPYWQIQRVLALAGGVALLLALAFSYALSRRTLGPVRRLAVAAEAARQGELDQKLSTRRGDVVGRLASSLDHLFRELRERRELQNIVLRVSRDPSESGGEFAGSAAAARAGKIALVAVELRRFASSKLGADPDFALEKLSRDLRRVESAASAHGGRMEANLGHRVVTSFDGENQALRAFSAATEIMHRLSTRESAFDEVEPPLVAISVGEVVSGSFSTGSRSGQALLGLPVQQMESLLREATPGEILLSKGIHELLGPAISEAEERPKAHRGMVSPQTFYLAPLEMAARITGIELATEASALLDATPESAPTSPADIAPGAVLGDRFEVLAALGGGASGVVFKVRDRDLGDVVALKMLKREWREPSLFERFKGELKLARGVHHPNVVRILDVGQYQGTPFVSTEFVPGPTLRQVLNRVGRLIPAAGLCFAKQLCAGVGAIHAVGLKHCNIRPENLIVDTTGVVRVMDGGMSIPSSVQTSGGRTGLAYLAPEQLEGRELSSASDLYACGVVLYEAFTGQLPFDTSGAGELVEARRTQSPTPPKTYWSTIPDSLEKILLKCLEPNAGRRYRTAEEMARDLASVRV